MDKIWDLCNEVIKDIKAIFSDLFGLYSWFV